MCSRLEKTHPLEHLNPQQKARKTTPNSQILNPHKYLAEKYRRIQYDKETDTRYL